VLKSCVLHPVCSSTHEDSHSLLSSSILHPCQSSPDALPSRKRDHKPTHFTSTGTLHGNEPKTGLYCQLTPYNNRYRLGPRSSQGTGVVFPISWNEVCFHACAHTVQTSIQSSTRTSPTSNRFLSSLVNWESFRNLCVLSLAPSRICLGLTLARRSSTMRTVSWLFLWDIKCKTTYKVWQSFVSESELMDL